MKREVRNSFRRVERAKEDGGRGRRLSIRGTEGGNRGWVSIIYEIICVK